MDAIDITDSAFSLDIPNTNDIITMDGVMKDYTMIIYIGATILVAFIGMFVYKFYTNKKVNDNQELDCEGGFCTMGDKPPSTSHI
jgi:hypothetical protein